MRYFIHLAYDGTRYHGWQIQPNGISVEGEIERCLSLLMRETVDIVGAGRTDAGVHARHMVAHFDWQADIDCAQLAYRLNKILPPDIVIYRIVQVEESMHARFSATSRTYHYYISTRKSPFNRQYTWRTHYDLDFALMNKAAEMLLQYKDFACFCKSHTDVKTTLCDVTEARWIAVRSAEQDKSEAVGLTEKDRNIDVSPAEDDNKVEMKPVVDGNDIVGCESTDWYFRITANRFLRNMVRAVVGTLVEVGRHRMTLEEFRQVIEGKKRTQAGESMPGNALFLERVGY